MRRRRFLCLLTGGAAAACVFPLAASAQQTGRIYRLGILHNQGPQAPQFPPFYDELRKLGFVEGQNLIVDSRGYALRTEQFPAWRRNSPRCSSTPLSVAAPRRPQALGRRADAVSRQSEV